MHRPIPASKKRTVHNFGYIFFFSKHSLHPLETGYGTESCFRHPLFDLRGTRKVEIRHINFHFSSEKVTSKSRKVKVFDLTIVKKLSTFRPKKAKVEKLKSRKVEKLKSWKVEVSPLKLQLFYYFSSHTIMFVYQHRMMLEPVSIVWPN